MQELIAELYYYARGAFKYKWIALIFAWVVSMGGWIFVYTIPDKFTSEAKVHVETRTMLMPLLRGMTVQTDTSALLRVMQQLMFTQSNLEQIIQMSDLEKVSNAAKRIDLIEDLKKNITIEGGRDDIFTIKYEAKSGSVAKSVVQAVLTVFSDQTKKSSLVGTDAAKKFINEQIREYETRLKNAEKAKENFKRANLGLLPGESGGQVAQAQQQKALLEDAKLQLIEAKSRQQAILDQLNNLSDSEDEWAITEVGGSASEEDSRIVALNEKKKELLIRFTDNHPEIVSINKLIKHLKKVKEGAERKKINVDEDIFNKPNVVANPYIQSIKVAQNEANAQVAAAQARVDELTARAEKIQEEIEVRLTVETELQNLNRDYDAIKSNYKHLLESREQANMSEKVDDQAESLKFKIADAPNIPLKPSYPKRGLFYSGILAAGVILGSALSVLIYMFKPTVLSTTQLRQLTGLPVLGGVSLKRNSAQATKNKKETIQFFGGALGLLLTYFALMTVELFEIKLSVILSLFHSVYQ